MEHHSWSSLWGKLECWGSDEHLNVDFASGVHSADYGDRIETATEEVVTQWAHGLAAKVLRPANMREQDVPKPQQNGLTRTAWRSDPYSLGSYTYIPPASGGKNDPSPLDMSEFAVPIWDNRLGFAGEHVS